MKRHILSKELLVAERIGWTINQNKRSSYVMTHNICIFLYWRATVGSINSFELKTFQQSEKFICSFVSFRIHAHFWSSPNFLVKFIVAALAVVIIVRSTYFWKIIKILGNCSLHITGSDRTHFHNSQNSWFMFSCFENL